MRLGCDMLICMPLHFVEKPEEFVVRVCLLLCIALWVIVQM